MISEQKVIPKLMTGLLESYLKDDETLDLQLVKAFQEKKAAEDFRVALRWVTSQLIELKDQYGFEGDIGGVPLKGLEFALKKCARIYLGLEAVRVNQATQEVQTTCARETPLCVVPFPGRERNVTDETPEPDSTCQQSSLGETPKGQSDCTMERRAGGDGRGTSEERGTFAS